MSLIAEPLFQPCWCFFVHLFTSLLSFSDPIHIHIIYFFLLFFFHWDRVSKYKKLASNLLCSQEWPYDFELLLIFLPPHFSKAGIQSMCHLCQVYSLFWFLVGVLLFISGCSRIHYIGQANFTEMHLPLPPLCWIKDVYYHTWPFFSCFTNLSSPPPPFLGGLFLRQIWACIILDIYLFYLRYILC